MRKPISHKTFKYIYRLVIFILLTLAAIFPMGENPLDSGFFIFAIFVWIAARLYLFGSNDFLSYLRAKASGPVAKIPLSKMTLSDASEDAVYASPTRLGDIPGYFFTISPTYSVASTKKRSLLNDQDTFSVSYLVAAIDLGKPIPHIFIDGLSQNAFKVSHPNLWALSKFLSKHDRLQDLEGDFSKHFRVYSAEQNSVPLTILAPDVMIKLRDRGNIFDYELYGQYLYIYREPRFNDTKEVDSYLAAVTEIAQEIFKQTQSQNFPTRESELRLKYKNLRFWGLMYSAWVTTKVVTAALLSVTYITILHSGVRGEL